MVKSHVLLLSLLIENYRGSPLCYHGMGEYGYSFLAKGPSETRAPMPLWSSLGSAPRSAQQQRWKQQELPGKARAAVPTRHILVIPRKEKRLSNCSCAPIVTAHTDHLQLGSLKLLSFLSPALPMSRGFHHSVPRTLPSYAEGWEAAALGPSHFAEMGCVGTKCCGCADDGFRHCLVL